MQAVGKHVSEGAQEASCWWPVRAGEENPTALTGGSENAAAPATLPCATMQCHEQPWVASGLETLSVAAQWDGRPGPLKGKTHFQSHPSMVQCCFVRLSLWHPEQHRKWEGAGINQTVAAAVCEQVVVMYLSLVSVKVIKENNLALTQCPFSPCVAPRITLPKADLL